MYAIIEIVEGYSSQNYSCGKQFNLPLATYGGQIITTEEGITYHVGGLHSSNIAVEIYQLEKSDSSGLIWNYVESIRYNKIWFGLAEIPLKDTCNGWT